MEAGSQTQEAGPNAPHPDDENPEEFFGGGEGNGEDPAASLIDDDAKAAGAAPADPPPPPPPPPADDPPADPPPAGQDATSGKKKTPTRDYEVLQEVGLTEEVLTALLKEVKTSPPRRALLPLGKVTAHSVEQALKTAYASNREHLGDSASLGAVSGGVKVKPVGPKQKPVEESIQVG